MRTVRHTTGTPVATLPTTVATPSIYRATRTSTVATRSTTATSSDESTEDSSEEDDDDDDDETVTTTEGKCTWEWFKLSLNLDDAETANEEAVRTVKTTKIEKKNTLTDLKNKLCLNLDNAEAANE